MWIRLFPTLLVLALIIALPCHLTAQEKDSDSAEASQSEEPEVEILTFDVLVTDADGNPVSKAMIRPWAMASAQGHGIWSETSHRGMAPKNVITNAKGIATVEYPKLANPDEQVKATAISISIDHPDHPMLSGLHIDVPRSEAYEAKLPRGASIEVELTLDGKPATGDDIRGVWTGGRPISASGLQFTDSGTIRIPPIAEGKAQLMFVRLDGTNATHFSKIESLKIDDANTVIKKKMELVPAVRLTGKLDDNVPRPVKNGRVKFESITSGDSWDEIAWADWAKVEEDGSFVIDAWPKDTPMQLVALCDGFIGKSGLDPKTKAPEKRPPGFLRPQAFMNPEAGELVVGMTPLQECQIEVRNGFDETLDEVIAAANPNVRWWNGGSQIYGYPLVKTSEYLRTAKMDFGGENDPYPMPFRATSNEQGQISLYLPVGTTSLWVANKRWQLPAVLGRRSKRINVESDQPLQLKLVLQPKGLDILGDWEDLCGLVFG